jgi:hypothetical protein
LRDGDTLLAWAQSMTGNGHPPVVELNHTEYPRGIPLGQKALRAVECRWERPPELPQWDILIRPAAPG